jgi:hypothetical protein
VFSATPFYVNETQPVTSRVVADNGVATKLTVKLTRDRTKLKRPILFLQPALTDDLVTIFNKEILVVLEQVCLHLGKR